MYLCTYYVDQTNIQPYVGVSNFGGGDELPIPTRYKMSVRPHVYTTNQKLMNERNTQGCEVNRLEIWPFARAEIIDDCTTHSASSNTNLSIIFYCEINKI